MRHRFFPGFMMALCCVGGTCWGAPPRAMLTLYVAPDGKDAWSGRLSRPNAARTNGPLATVSAARDAIRRARESRGRGGRDVRVLLHGGRYRLTEPFSLTPLDSRVTYTAVPGEKPILSGGEVLDGWTVDRDGLWHLRIPDVSAGRWVFHQLFVNGERRTRARSPNEGWFTVAGKAPPAVDPTSGEKTVRDRTAFVFTLGDIKSWPNLNDVNVVVYHSWETSRLRIAAVDETKHIVSFTGPAHWPFLRWGPGQRYYVENLPEALDAPGEWFLDRHTGVLTYYPLPGEKPENTQVIAPRLTRLVELKGDPELGLWVESVVFRGLTFQEEDWDLEPEGHSDSQAVWSAPAAIMADGAVDCMFENCEIAHVGHYGIWFRRGCRRNRIVHNRIHDLGVGGVRIGQTHRPRPETLASCYNVVDNNHIFDGGHVYAGGVGVWMAQSHHNVISHNEIHDFNYSGMSIGWNWNDAPNECHHNTIEFNHVHHVMRRQLNDGGAIYTLGTSPGSVIRNNVFHDVWPYSGIGWGVYLDSTTNGYLVENNIVYNILSGGLMKHNGGHENVIRNNIFAFSAEQMLWPCWARQANTFERNIVYFTQGLLFIPMAERRLRARRGAGESLGVWDYNLFWNPNDPDIHFFRYTFDEWRTMGLDRHSLIADPRFKDAAMYDFRLEPTSPALKLGFKPIDGARAGLYGDPEWVAEGRKMKHPPTKLPPAPPPPKPVSVDDDFEQAAVGERPAGAVVSGEEKGASIRVTDDRAATGRHCLRFTDVSGLDKSWQPHMFYRPRFRRGRVRESFDIFLEPNALVYTEWRDATEYPHNIGPSVTFTAGNDGRAKVTASGTDAGVIPLRKWVHVEIECTLGKREPARYSLKLTLPGGPARELTGIPISGDRFRELHWLGFVSNATMDSQFDVDNIRILVSDNDAAEAE